MKNYNPFKMWGSYLGAIFFLVFNIIFLNFVLQISEDFPLNLNLGIFSIFCGFLIGWMIHSLARGFK